MRDLKSHCDTIFFMCIDIQYNYDEMVNPDGVTLHSYHNSFNGSCIQLPFCIIGRVVILVFVEVNGIWWQFTTSFVTPLRHPCDTLKYFL